MDDNVVPERTQFMQTFPHPRSRAGERLVCRFVSLRQNVEIRLQSGKVSAPETWIPPRNKTLEDGLQRLFTLLNIRA
jgi:hypothetical protein